MYKLHVTLYLLVLDKVRIHLVSKYIMLILMNTLLSLWRSRIKITVSNK